MSPIIEFGERDILRGKIVTPAWYRVHIESVGEAPSKDQQSTNYLVAGTIVKNADNGDGAFSGVPLDWNFNSKAIGFSVGYLEAFGQTVTAGKRFDLSDTENGDIDVFVENDTYNGRLVNKVNHKYRKAE